MTRNSFLKNNKSKLILVLLMVGILFVSLFSVACNKSTEKSELPTYNYTETDDGDISNPSFAYGTITTELTSFPKTSPKGWSRSKDSNGKITQSSAKSGAINVTDAGWEELQTALYKDSSLLEFVKQTKDFTTSDVKEAIREEKGDDDYTPTSDEIREYIIEHYFDVFSNPGTRPGSEDKIVYMLNNFRSSTYLGIGTSQKITSSSKITLNKGEYGKISVWVKTQNIKESPNGDYGANIRLATTLNGVSQAEYALTNIIAEEWAQYTLYVKADEYYETTVTLSLGLGYGLDGITQGTAFFDDVAFTHIDKETFDKETENKTALKNTFIYNGEDDTVIKTSEVGPDNYLLCDLTFTDYLTANANGYIDKVDATIANDFTASNTGISGKPFADSTQTVTDYTFGADEVKPFPSATAKKVTVNKASATLKYTSDDFKVGCEEYVYLAFYVKNQLSKFGVSDVTFNVIDKFETTEKLNASVASVSTVSDEWQKVDLVIKNNFAKDASYPERTFILEIVVGPADLTTAKYADDFATGDVLITAPVFATGTTAEYEGDDVNAEKEADKYYTLYSLLSGSASGSVALYAGYSSDYTETQTSESYAFEVSPNDIGKLNERPTGLKGYTGITANTFYVKEETDGVTLESDTDTRKNGDTDGNVAGLINTKYLSEYESKISSLSGLSSALNFTATEEEKNIQPLMIYNNVANHYGYIGKTNTISSSDYAKVSVELKVAGDANAYVYLVDVENNMKDVLTFNYPTDDSTYELMLKVTDDMMSDNGWVEIEFYIATGAKARNFRVEVWNGGRDGENATASQGYVFIKNISVTTSGAFTEPSRLADAFSVSGNPLYTEQVTDGELFDTLLTYTRELTDLEKKYNSEHSSADDVKYNPNYVWAKNDTMIYAIYNTINPVEVDPYDKETSDDTAVSDGCTAETDPSTFWLSFSSILLAVALVVAIIMLLIKNIRRRRKANASDAKSHYTITSRTKSKKPAKKAKKTEEIADEVEEVEEEQADEEAVEETEVAEEVIEETSDETEDKKEETLDSYVYGDVEVFGEDDKKE